MTTHIEPHAIAEGRVGLAHVRWPLVALFAGILFPLLGFGYIAYGVAAGGTFGFDRPLLMGLHHLARPGFDAAMVAFSHAGSGRWMLPVDAVVLTVLLAQRMYRDATYWTVSVGGASLLNYAAKHVFERTRPHLWLSIAPESTFSFPSGHAMQTLAPVAAVVVLLWPTRWRIPALVIGVAFVACVGLSRVYLGVHYPSDVLGGWLASAAWVAGTSMLLRPSRALPAAPR